MSKYLSNCLLLYVLILNLVQAQDESLQPKMDQILSSFRELQTYTSSLNKFSNPENESAIQAALLKLGTNFYKVIQSSSHGKHSDPGFQVTLKVLDELIEDARNRFNEGNKDYALWRLRSVSEHCVTCHTRYTVPTPFISTTPPTELKTELEQAEFYLAARQFEKAAKLLKNFIINSNPSHDRLEALRKWLIIYVRVWSDPNRALNELKVITSQARLNTLEKETVLDWVRSLSSWKEERAKNLDPLRKAESLIHAGLSSDDLSYNSTAAVELLRASALLHKLLEVEKQKERRGRALYLLGLTYSRMPHFFIGELPEIFLEQAIREIPGSQSAKNAYKLYFDLISIDFGGVSGNTLPDDIELRLKELRDIAYGVKVIEDRI